MLCFAFVALEVCVQLKATSAVLVVVVPLFYLIMSALHLKICLTLMPINCTVLNVIVGLKMLPVTH